MSRHDELVKAARYDSTEPDAEIDRAITEIQKVIAVHREALAGLAKAIQATPELVAILRCIAYEQLILEKWGQRGLRKAEVIGGKIAQLWAAGEARDVIETLKTRRSLNVDVPPSTSPG